MKHRIPPVLAPVLALTISACAQVGSGISEATSGPSFDAAAKLPLGSFSDPATMPKALTVAADAASDVQIANRNAILLRWMTLSDQNCATYENQIQDIARDENIAAKGSTTILSGLATIFSKVQTIHPLTGAATIISGLDDDVSNAAFLKQSGDLLVTAIDQARADKASAIKGHFTDTLIVYPFELGMMDVNSYNNTCSIQTALVQIRKSLNTSNGVQVTTDTKGNVTANIPTGNSTGSNTTVKTIPANPAAGVAATTTVIQNQPVTPAPVVVAPPQQLAPPLQLAPSPERVSPPGQEPPPPPPPPPPPH